LDDEQRRQLAGDLLRRGIESRVISMEDERPLETLITHTSEELRQAARACKGADSARVWRGVSSSAGEMEAFAELLERFAIDRGTRALELVSD
jgi:hypothetical protein